MTLREHMLRLLESTKADRKGYYDLGLPHDSYDLGAIAALDRVIERIERILETVEAAR